MKHVLLLAQVASYLNGHVLVAGEALLPVLKVQLASSSIAESCTFRTSSVLTPS